MATRWTQGRACHLGFNQFHESYHSQLKKKKKKRKQWNVQNAIRKTLIVVGKVLMGHNVGDATVVDTVITNLPWKDTQKNGLLPALSVGTIKPIQKDVIANVVWSALNRGKFNIISHP